MILFQSEAYQIDLSLNGITLNEESNMFVDNMIKSYSFPFSLDMSPELSQMLGLPEIDNVKRSAASIKGRLIVDGTYYDAEMVLGDTQGERVEAEIYYGEEVLPVYDSKLNALPWPVHLVLSSSDLYNKYVDKSWPDVTHNFPMVYRADIKKESDYEDFEFFANNTSGSDFIQNIQEMEEGVPVYRNKNVLMPCTYVLEILRFGFAQAGKKIRGSVINDDRLKNLIYLPETYLEKFKGSTYTNFQFDFTDRTDNFGSNVGIYERSFTPDEVGTYQIKVNLNIDPVTAQYFSFRVYQVNPLGGAETPIYNSFSRNNAVNIDEEINIDVTVTNLNHPIWVELTLTYTSESIAAKNSFEYSYKEGRLNELIGSYRLSEFMPDMTFGEFVNLLKNWWNLDITFNEEYVYIDFVEDVISDFPTVDHSRLEMPKPTKTHNNVRTFRLLYSDESQVLVDSSGQIYSDLGKNKNDIVEIEMDVEMAVVQSNFSIVTAIFNESSKMSFALYNGLTNGKNTCKPDINGFTGRVDNVYTNFWKKWLAIRTNNIKIKDKFVAHQSEKINLRTLIGKYNHVMLPMSFRKKRKHQEYWEVEMEAETIG